MIERKGWQRRNGRLMKFRDFMKRRSLKEEIAINTVRHQMHCDSLRRCLVEAPAHLLG